ncbi:MAG: sn-glycerol-1-phosphate dehydrogenase [Angelakisella sp.]|nr:sn-glycerol-1-phosphate dehydrogenase [Angelakisella sp.]
MDMVIEPEVFGVNDYINKEFDCDCGRIHKTTLKNVAIYPDAISELLEIMQQNHCSKPFIICDRNTELAAAKKVQSILTEKAHVALHKIDRDEVVPDEYTLGELLMACPADTDLIIAVGSGTINDLSKYLSYRLRLPYIIVATAPSMDGFASAGAALVTNRLKTTYDAHMPLAIIGDVNILAAAPMELIIAGISDILGKYSCLMDWQLAHIVNNEYYCSTIVRMVRHSINEVEKNSQGVLNREPSAVASVMEALVLTGIAMSFSGNSRPASGSEHHISHFWEMQFLFQGRKAIPHGIKVGIGTVIASYLYHNLANETPDFKEAQYKAQKFDVEKWENDVTAAFSFAAPEVIALEKRCKKNDVALCLKRQVIIEQYWNEITASIHELVPTPEKMIEMLHHLGAPAMPTQIDVSIKNTIDAIIMAKEVRDRYTVLQLLWDLGMLGRFAADTVDWMEQYQKWEE